MAEARRTAVIYGPNNEPIDTNAVKQSLRQGPQTRTVPLIGMPRFAAFTGMVGQVAYNPDPIGFDTLDQMRRYPVLRAAMMLVKSPILARFRKASIDCDDPAVKRFLESTLLDSGVIYRLARAALNALDFGVDFNEIVWQSEVLELDYEEDDPITGEPQRLPAWHGPATTIRETREVNPATVKAILRTPPDDAHPGEFNGFLQSPEIQIDPINCFVYTHAPEFGNLWGYARTRDAHPYYYWLQGLWRWWANYTEKKVVPPRIARHPEGTMADGGDNAEFAVEVLGAIDNETVVAMPNTETASGKYEWDIEEKPVSERYQAFDAFRTAAERECLLACFVPERVFMEGHFGTKAEADRHTETFLMATDAELFDLVAELDSKVVQRVAALNFGSKVADARLVVSGLTDDERVFLSEVFAKLLSNPNLAQDIQNTIDIRDLAEYFDVPTIDAAVAGAPEPDAPDPAIGAGQPEPESSSGAPAPFGSPGSAANLEDWPVGWTPLVSPDLVERVSRHAADLALAFSRAEQS